MAFTARRVHYGHYALHGELDLELSRFVSQFVSKFVDAYVANSLVDTGKCYVTTLPSIEEMKAVTKRYYGEEMAFAGFSAVYDPGDEKYIFVCLEACGFDCPIYAVATFFHECVHVAIKMINYDRPGFEDYVARYSLNFIQACKRFLMEGGFGDKEAENMVSYYMNEPLEFFVDCTVASSTRIIPEFFTYDVPGQAIYGGLRKFVVTQPALYNLVNRTIDVSRLRRIVIRLKPGFNNALQELGRKVASLYGRTL